MQIKQNFLQRQLSMFSSGNGNMQKSSLRPIPTDVSRAVWKKLQMGPFNISKHLDRCVLFRAISELVPWAELFQNLTKINE